MLCCVHISFAQHESYFNTVSSNGVERTFYGGVVAGINASQVDGDNYAGFHKAGLNIGLITYAKINKQFLLSMEMLYSMKGAKNVQVINSSAVGSVPDIYVSKLNYIEIPVMIHYITKSNLIFGIGISYSQLLKSSETEDADQPVNFDPEATPFRKNDFNYLISVNYQLYKNLFARVRYQYSITTIRDSDKIPLQFGTSAQYNNLFCLQLMYVF
jgi:hypothetical protein